MSLVSHTLVFQDNRKQLHQKEYSTAVFNMAAAIHMGYWFALCRYKCRWALPVNISSISNSVQNTPSVIIYSECVLEKYPGYIWLIKYVILIHHFFFNVATRKFKITHVASIHCSYCMSVGQH